MTLLMDRKMIRQELGVEADGVTYQAGGYTVRRASQTRRSVKLAAAVDAGVWTPELDDRMGDYVSESTFDRWHVKRAGEPATDLDFGPAPF